MSKSSRSMTKEKFINNTKNIGKYLRSIFFILGNATISDAVRKTATMPYPSNIVGPVTFVTFTASTSVMLVNSIIIINITFIIRYIVH